MGEIGHRLMWRGLVRCHLPQGQFVSEAWKDRIDSMMMLGFSPEKTVNALVNNDKLSLDRADWMTKRKRGKR